MTRRYSDDHDFWVPPVDKRAVVNAGFLKAGIGVDRPPPAYAEDRKLQWQSVASWGDGCSSLGRCDDHPRLERLIEMHDDGRSTWTYFVNGQATPSLAAALAAVAIAEEAGRYPRHGETFFTYEPPVVQGEASPASRGTSEADSIEGMMR